MDFEVYPESKFVVCSEHEIETDQRLTLPNGQQEEAYLAFKVEKVGVTVNEDRDGESVLLPDDLILVKKSDVNFIYFLGKTVCYVDHSFAIKIKLTQ